jgi:hypothetical protein
MIAVPTYQPTLKRSERSQRPVMTDLFGSGCFL